MMAPPTSAPRNLVEGYCPARHQAGDDAQIRHLTVSTTAIEAKSAPAVTVSNPSFVLADGTEGGPARFVLGRSYDDADDQGTAARDPNAEGMGHLGTAGGRCHPRMRISRLDAGPGRSACPEACRDHRSGRS